MTEKQTPTEKPVTTRKDLEARIVAKAWKDSKYKERLLKDPKGVVQQEVHAIDPSIKLPEKLKIHVHEESATAAHLVVPRNPNDVSPAEASEDLKDVPPHKIAVVRSLRMG